MEDTRPDICPGCLKRKKPSSRGSITQWIFKDDICTCNDELVHYVGLDSRCSACGGVPADAHGSLTQWIFRARRCQCLPTSTINPPAPLVGEQRDFGLVSAPEPEEEIHFAPNQFPVERYTPLKLLGTGGSGAVYKCFDGSIRRLVAVKLLRHLSADTQVQFQQEAKITSQLVHPSALQILDFNLTTGGVPYMVTEYVESQSLREYLTEHGTLQPHEAARLFSSIADLLQFAHEREIYHGDLKPENILVSNKDGELAVKVIDFALAKLKPVEQATTQDGKTVTIVGTPAYTSPEHWESGRFDGQSDIYSLGCVLFEVLSGRQVFQADSPLVYMLKHQTEQTPSLAAEHPELAFVDQFDGLIARCLSKKKEYRYKSPRELSVDLERIAGADVKYQPPAPPEPYEPIVSQGPRSSPQVAVLLLMSLAVLFGGLIAYPLITSSLSKSVRARVELDKVDDLSKPRRSSGENAPKDTKATVLEELPGTFPVSPPQFKEAKPGLWLATGDTTDDALKVFASRKIDRLGLSHKEITGSGFKYLANTGIHGIFLSYSTISDKGLIELAKIDTLNNILLDNTDITDRGIENLIKLKSLRYIDLSNTAITDRSLEILAQNTQLDRLIIGGCKLSKEALKSFRQKLPGCEVLRRRKINFD